MTRAPIKGPLGGLKLAGRGAALALVLGVAAQAAPPTGPLAPGAPYVAMGSSFAAGPGVTERAETSSDGCSQSKDNYPRQLDRALKLTLTDRSCSGAKTTDVLAAGQFGLPAQLDGLTAQTRLVTVTIGGNDVRITADLGLAACRHRRLAQPAGPACAAAPAFDLEQAFALTATNMRAIAGEVRRRAPGARLVFVDYVTVLPPGPPCAALELSAADADDLRGRSERLARLTETIAAETGAELIKASALTRGHDACAPDPWTEAAAPSRSPSGQGGAPFHPRLAAMTAVARALEERLAR